MAGAGVHEAARTLAWQLPLADAIEKLSAFGSTASGSNDTQIHPQTPDISCNRQSSCGTSPVGAELSKVVYPEEFWHKPDTVRRWGTT